VPSWYRTCRRYSLQLLIWRLFVCLWYVCLFVLHIICELCVNWQELHVTLKHPKICAEHNMCAAILYFTGSWNLHENKAVCNNNCAENSHWSNRHWDKVNIYTVCLFETRETGECDRREERHSWSCNAHLNGSSSIKPYKTHTLHP